MMTRTPIRTMSISVGAATVAMAEQTIQMALGGTIQTDAAPETAIPAMLGRSQPALGVAQ